MDESATGGIDFEDKSGAFGNITEAIEINPGETVTYNLEIFTDDVCELSEETFGLMLVDTYGVPIPGMVNNTMNITIAPDLECGKYSVSLFY